MAEKMGGWRDDGEDEEEDGRDMVRERVWVWKCRPVKMTMKMPVRKTNAAKKHNNSGWW